MTRESSLRNSRCWFVLNVFGLCKHLWVLQWTGKSKWDSNAVSSCLENWKILWSVLSLLTAAYVQCFAFFHRPHLSPISIFLTNSLTRNLCKGQKCSTEQIGNYDFQAGSPLVMVLHQDSVSQFSLQPQTAFKSSFNFPDQYNTIFPCKGRKCSALLIQLTLLIQGPTAQQLTCRSTHG